MTVEEFTFFVESLVNREIVYDPNFSLGDHLKKRHIGSIHVNTERAFALFENRKQYRGDVDGDFSVRRLALDQLGQDVVSLARIQDAAPEKLLEFGIDFDSSILEYLLPEKITAFGPADVRAALTELINTMNSDSRNPNEKEAAASSYMFLFKLVEFHADREKIVEGLEDRNGGDGQRHETDYDPSSATGAIKIQSSKRIDGLIDDFFAPDNRDYDVTEFCDSFARLLKTGQQPKAQEVVSRLIEYMTAANPDSRQKALNLLSAILEQMNSASDREVIETAVEGVVNSLAAREETYEYSELVWKLFEKCHAEKQYRLMVSLTTAMAARRRVTDNVTVYDSMAVKKGFENISRPETVARLIDELVEVDHQQSGHLKGVMVAIGSEEIALGLSRIISHPVRQVRQLTLKTLAELGKSSLKVFSRILYDDTMFERESDRHELPDGKWYVVRNSIFVLGSLHDRQGVPALQVRISDKDVRVRREIIRALEKVGGEEAVDCLTLMSEDPLGEIREAAIIAIGLIGQPESAPLLIDIARRHSTEVIKAITSLGKLGGETARAFLGDLLDDPQELAKLAGGKASRDDLRVSIIKALGQIGNPDAISQIKRYRENQSAASKILFKNSPVNKAISEVLSRH